MKIGQTELSERTGQRSGLVVTPTNVAPSVILEGEDYGLKANIIVHNDRRERGLSVLK
jgi:hypothetical protein